MLRNFFIFLNSCSLLLISNTVIANDDKPETSTWLYGVGTLYKQQIYKDFDQRSIVIPVFGYQGQKLQVFGPFVKYQLLEKNHWTVNAHLSPRFDGYEESDGQIFTGMQERKDSLDAGFEVTYTNKDWQVGLKNSQDVLSRSEGTEIALSLGKQWKLKSWSVMPNATVSHWNSKLSDYYFGVREDEASTFREAYQADSTINYKFGFDFNRRLPLGLLRFSVHHTSFGSEITGSPLVDSSDSLSFQLFFILSK